MHVLRLSILLILCITASTAGTSGQSRPNTDGPSPLPNAMCPVLDDEPASEEFRVDYQGKPVYLCCKKCARLFKKKPEKYLINLPQFQTSRSPSDQADRIGRHHDESAAHNHADHHAKTNGPVTFRRITGYLGLFHPLAVHFPISLIVLAGVAEFMATRKGDDVFGVTRRFLLWTAAMTTIPAVLLGLCAAGSLQVPRILWWHRLLGIGAALSISATLILVEKHHNHPEKHTRRLYRILLAIAVLCVAVGGHLGGLYSRGLDYYTF